MGPEPRVRTWPPGRRPAMRVYAEGAWRRAWVLQRQDWPDGRTAYMLDVLLPSRPPIPGDPHSQDYFVRTYWWGTGSMTPVKRSSS